MSPLSTLRLGTRKSALAQAQSRWVADRLTAAFPDLKVEFVLITTSGDMSDKPAAAAPRGGLKAQFTKEIEDALLADRIDLAVHSMKDMPAELPAGLTIGAVPEREDPRDVWISKNRIPFKELPQKATIATGAVRRQAQLRHLRKDLILVPLRGNVDTRLKKLRDADFDGMILALAGLMRLGLDSAATEILSLDQMVPAVGQGALAIEIRSGDRKIAPYLKVLDHAPTHHAIRAERRFLQTLGGSCQTPIAAYATVANNQLTMSGLIVAPTGDPYIRATDHGPVTQAAEIGQRLAETLLAQGGKKILDGSGTAS